jgi:hypothetical protein
LFLASKIQRKELLGKYEESISLSPLCFIKSDPISASVLTPVSVCGAVRGPLATHFMESEEMALRSQKVHEMTSLYGGC